MCFFFLWGGNYLLNNETREQNWFCFNSTVQNHPYIHKSIDNMSGMLKLSFNEKIKRRFSFFQENTHVYPHR